MKPRIFIRVDGGKDIGLGHINRCHALASFLRDEFEICFFCKQIPPDSESEISDDGFIVNKIGNETDIISGLSPEIIVVLDGYQFKTDYQKQIKDKGSILVCIDDLQDKHYLADILISHGEGSDISGFSVEPYTKVLTGLKYVLLRSSFLNTADRTVEKKETDILICIGGADPGDISSEIVKAILGSGLSLYVTVVVGNTYSGNLLRSQNKNVRLLKNLKANEFADIMRNSSVGILPSSTVAIEAIAMRLPFLTFYYAENQKVFYRFLISNSFALPIDIKEINPSEIFASVNKIKSEHSIYEKRYGDLIDFRSPERLRETFKTLRYEK